MITFTHRHVESFEDCTQNFEQLEGILPQFATTSEIVVNVKDSPYNAAGNGISDDTAAVQAAINAVAPNKYAPNAGGVVFFPPGRYFCPNGVSADEKDNVTLRGAGSRYGGSQLYSTSTSSTLISARSSGGFRLEQLAAYNSNASYTGTLVDLSKLPSGSQDTGLARITDCNLTVTQAVGQTAFLLLLQNAEACTVTGNYFIGGGTAIRGMLGAGDFSHGHFIRDNFFQGQAATSIVDLAQANNVIGNIFEPLVNGHAGAYFQDATLPCNGLTWINNYMSDVGAQLGNWLTVYGNGIFVAGNSFDAGAIGIVLNGSCNGVTITGNQFDGETHSLDPSSGTHQRLTYLGNYENSVTTPIATTSTFGAGCVWQDASGGLHTNQDLVVDDGSTTSLRLGNHGGAASIIYFRSPTGVEDTSIYRGAAGQINVPALAVGGNVGFYGTPPVAQPALGAATAAGTYGANEQQMLQKAYNALRTLGLAS